MLFILIVLLFTTLHSQTIKQLNEISIKEELPIGSIITFLTDKIPNLEQALEYDLVTPLSSDFDLFFINHTRHSLNLKKRLDYEQICSKKTSHSCVLSISIAVSNRDTIDVYILPIQIENIDDNPMKFSVNRTVIEIEENDDNWFKKSYSLPSATDADGDLITYSIYLQNWQKPNGLFSLDEDNLFLKPLKQFDREEQNLYLLRLVAHNKHQKDLSTDIIVIIKDQNDNPPKCQFNQTLFTINTIESLSIFSVNATDLDEGDNAKLEYQLSNPLPGFTIKPDNGQIVFDYTKWIRGNQSKLFVNITDHGQPYRLSTQCVVDLQLTFSYDIQLKSRDIISIENLNSSIGQLMIIDRKVKQTCWNCVIRVHSSFEEIFLFNQTTGDLYLNFNSMILRRILSNYLIKQESLPVTMNIDVRDKDNPSIISSKNYSLIFNFNKEKILINSNTFFLQIHENILLNESISLFNQYHSCLNNRSKDWKLIDPTNTFDINQNFHLILKKYLHTKQQEYYQVFLKDDNNQTNPTTQCSIELRVFVSNSYSISNVYPYFSQSFYILTSSNISSFVLPILPSYVKYISSKSNEISIDEINGSMTIRSPSLYSFYSYDFQIQVIDSQTPSLSCAIPVRIFFGINHQSPRLVNNYTQQTIEISSIYQIEAYDPDLSKKNFNKVLPPSIEYQIEPSEDLEIDRYTGRIFFKNFNQSKYDFTLILTDFGQPNRLITRERITFHIQSNEKLKRQEVSMFISRTFILISAGVFAILIFFILIFSLFHFCSDKLSNKNSLSNLTPDIRLIDNEYITTTTSLPRIINREQRIYPTVSNDNQRKLLEQIHLPPPPLYSTVKQDHQHSLSINDINKYLERFEKIYNNSSDAHFREPVGSVV